jgi:sugar phosphate isomerase/epimerase
MIAISTAWNGRRMGGPSGAVREIRELGHGAVELEVPASGEGGTAAGRLCRELSVRCRVVRATPEPGGGLSSPDEGVRAEAIRAVLAALPGAAAAQAEVVVFALGAIEGDAAAPDVRERHLDRAARSLFSLRKAEPGVTFAFLTPADVRALPSIDEVEHLLEDAAGARIAYVHDAARARILEREGISDSLAWLDRHGRATAGLVLADVAGDVTGLPPGAGEVDFTALAAAAGSAMHRTLRLDPRHSAAELALGVDHLRAAGFGGG